MLQDQENEKGIPPKIKAHEIIEDQCCIDRYKRWEIGEEKQFKKKFEALALVFAKEILKESI